MAGNCGLCLDGAILNTHSEDIHQGVFAVENTWNDFGVLDAEGKNSGGNIVMVVAAKLALLGNTLTDSTSGEHVVRIVHAEGAVVSNNITADQADRKAVLTIRSAPQNEVCTAGCQRHTRHVVVSDNVCHGRATHFYTAVDSNAASTKTAFGEDIIFERNFFDRTDTPTLTPPRAAINIGSTNAEAKEVTIRNNLCIANNWASPMCFSGGDRVLANTCYSNDATSERVICVQRAKSAHNTCCTRRTPATAG